MLSQVSRSSRRDYTSPRKRPQNSQEVSASSSFEIHEDDDANALTELDSEQVLVPTEYQETNKDSMKAQAEPRSAFQAPFDYSWVRWVDRGLSGYRRVSRPFKTVAWWWKYGVPLEGKYTTNAREEKPGTFFLCRSCYKDSLSRNYKFNITNGTKGVLDHFRAVHWRTYQEEIEHLNDALDRADALEFVDNTDPKQQELYNRIIEKFDPEALQKDILRWVIYDNIPFKKLQSPHFRQILSRFYLFIDKEVIPSDCTVARWLMKEFKLIQ